jgi:hypothetical protein
VLFPKALYAFALRPLTPLCKNYKSLQARGPRPSKPLCKKLQVFTGWRPIRLCLEAFYASLQKLQVFTGSRPVRLSLEALCVLIRPSANNYKSLQITKSLCKNYKSLQARGPYAFALRPSTPLYKNLAKHLAKNFSCKNYKSLQGRGPALALAQCVLSVRTNQ